MKENKPLKPNVAGHWFGKPMNTLRLATIIVNQRRAR